MIIHIIKKTDKKGNAREIEVYRTSKKANEVSNAKNKFGARVGEKFEVIEREVADGTVLPVYS